MSFKGHTHSEEVKKRLSETHQGLQTWKGKQHSEESKKLISKNRSGKSPWNKGKKCPQISKSKLGKKRKPHSTETKQLMSEQRKGFKHSLESRKRMSENHSFNPKSEYGKQGLHNGIPYQSSYELHFMQLLDEYKIPYERANQFKIKYVFENNEHYYYPDFYLPREDLIVEIKSSYRMQDIRTKIKLTTAKEKYGEQFLILTEQELPELVTGASNEINKIRSSKFIGSQRI